MSDRSSRSGVVGLAVLSRFAWIVVLLFSVELVYIPWSVLWGENSLFGWDYILLHARRLTFARDVLFGGGHTLPGWYSRQMLGTPFSANLQNVPWIPSHLVLFLFNPDTAYAAGVAIAAALSALFTYLFCRRSGLSQIGAMAAASTFSCSGFFACRVMTGALTMLEAYPSLPLLLWLADRATDRLRTKVHRRDIAALAICTACTVVAGHPQLPAYSVAAAFCYVIWRCLTGRQNNAWLCVRLCGAMVLGIGATMAAWWPMLLLIRRSTRILPVAASAADIVLPYHRLLAIVIPGIDGWPAGMKAAVANPFTGAAALFWDTFAYVGILPLAASAILICICVVQRRWPSSRWMFLATIGLAALIFATPLSEPLRRLIPGTILRSPARLLYLSTFSLSAALGVGIDVLWRWNPQGRAALARSAVFLCFAFHVWDVGRVSHSFILPAPLHPAVIPVFEQFLARETGGRRVAVSVVLAPHLGYLHDDPGGYDSIFLKEPYRALTALADARPGYNEEYMDAASWPPSTLKATSTEFVVTWQDRADLDLVKTAAGLRLYRVNGAAPRASFVNSTAGDSVDYLRPSSDRILLHTANTRNGIVHIVEANDPGWSAQVDGVSAPILDANGLGMAIPVSAGAHEIRLHYRTPGRTTGVLLSLLSVGLLAVLMAVSARPRYFRQGPRTSLSP